MRPEQVSSLVAKDQLATRDTSQAHLERDGLATQSDGHPGTQLGHFDDGQEHIPQRDRAGGPRVLGPQFGGVADVVGEDTALEELSAREDPPSLDMEYGVAVLGQPVAVTLDGVFRANHRHRPASKADSLLSDEGG